MVQIFDKKLEANLTSFANFVGLLLEIKTKFAVKLLPSNSQEIGYTLLNGQKTTFIYVNPFHDCLKGNDGSYDKRILLGVVVHEVLHSKYTYPEYLQRAMERNKIKYANVLKDLWNILEDFTIESRAIKDLALDGGQVTRLEKILKNKIKGYEPLKLLDTAIFLIWDKQPPVTVDEPAYGQVADALIAFTDIGPLPAGSEMTDEAKAVFVKIASMFYDAIWEDAQTRMNVVLEAYKLVEPLIDQDPDNKQESNSSNGLGDTRGNNSNSESKPSQEDRSDVERSKSMKIKRAVLRKMQEDNKQNDKGSDKGNDQSDKDSGNSSGSDQSEQDSGDSSADNTTNNDKSANGNDKSSNDKNNSTSNDKKKSSGDADRSSDKNGDSDQDTNGTKDSNHGNDSDDNGNDKNADDPSMSDSSDNAKNSCDNNGTSSDMNDNVCQDDESDSDANDANQTSQTASDSDKDSYIDISKRDLEDDDLIDDIKQLEREVINENIDFSELAPSTPEFGEVSNENTNKQVVEDYRDIDLEKRKYGNHVIQCKNIYTTSVSNETLRVYDSVCSTHRDKISAIKRALEHATEEEDKVISKSGKFCVDRYCKKRGTTLEVFTKIKEKTKKDSAVCILADCSGSMGGRKIEQEKIILAVLAEALAKVGIPFKVITFCDTGDAVVHHHYVNYRNSRTERAALMTITCNGNNFDGYSIRYAIEDLKKQKATNKLLIIISDGQPNPLHSVSDPVGDTRDAVIEARRSQNVRVCGIALGVSESTHNVLHAIYHKRDDDDSFLSIKNEKDLRDALPRLIKKEVRKW